MLPALDESEIQQMLAPFRTRRAELIASLVKTTGGLAWCHRHTALVDEALRGLFHRLIPSPFHDSVCLIATGGYGRSEMAPFSDADIALVPSEDLGPEFDAANKHLYMACNRLRDDLGVIATSAYRPVSEIGGLDLVSRSSLLDARLIAGSETKFEELVQAVRQTHPIGEFIASKLDQRREDLERSHASPLVVEPNLKSGAGGVRSFHTANWIRASLGLTPLQPSPQLDAVLAARNLLHRVTGKKSDVLKRARQSEICDLTGSDRSAWMTHLLRSMETLENQFSEALQLIRDSRFLISEGVHADRGEVRMEPMLDPGIAAVGVTLATQIGLDIRPFPNRFSDTVSGDSFLFALAKGEAVIRALDRAQVLQEVLPELESCRTLLSRDEVHRFTVFEHTLQAIRHLHGDAVPAWLTELRHQVADLGPLTLALLLHDTGKVDPSREHSRLGAELARDRCQRLGLAPGVTDLVVFLVREHLSMAHTMRLRDLEQMETIQEFASLVRDESTLNQLTLLTYCDIRAVTPELWTEAQESFLQTLYERTRHHLQSAGGAEVNPRDWVTHKKQLATRSAPDDIDPAEFKALIETMPSHYLASTPLDRIADHVGFVQRARAGEIVIEFDRSRDGTGSEITVCAPDKPGLLAQILGVMYIHELSVPVIRACTTKTEPPIALDVIGVNHSGRVPDRRLLERLAKDLQAVLSGATSVESLIESKQKDPYRRTNILRIELHSGSPPILEIHCPRGRGNPYRLARMIHHLGWNVQSARVGQWAGQAAASFYLQHSSPLTEDEVRRAIDLYQSQTH